MLSLAFLALGIAIIWVHLYSDKSISILSPIIVFQLYSILQLQVNLFLGTNYYLPRFQNISPKFSFGDTLYLGVLFTSAQLVLIIAFYLMPIRAIGFSNTRFKLWSRVAVNLVCIALFVVGYLSLFALFQLNGGYSAFIAQRELWRTAGVSGQGWVILPATSMLAVAACAILVNNREKMYGIAGFIRLLIVSGLTILPATQLGFRGLVFLPLLQITFFYHTFVNRIKISSILIGAISLLSLFTLQGIQREVPYDASKGTYYEYLVVTYYTRPDVVYSVFLRSMGADIVQTTIDHVNITGQFQNLYPAVIEASTILIPQSIWGEKPVPLSVKYSRQLFDLDGGVSATIVGEGFWHFGELGVIILMITMGAFMRYFQELQKISESNPDAALLMLSIYPYLFMAAEAFQGNFNAIVIVIILNFVVRSAFNLASWRQRATATHGLLPGAM